MPYFINHGIPIVSHFHCIYLSFFICVTCRLRAHVANVCCCNQCDKNKIYLILSFLGPFSLQCVQNVMNGHFSFSFITRFLFPLRHVVVMSTSTRGLIIRAKLSSSITIYTQIAKFIGANMGSIWVLSAPDGPHVGPMNFAIRETEPDRTLEPSVPGHQQT